MTDCFPTLSCTSINEIPRDPFGRRRGSVVRVLGLHAVAPGSDPVLTSEARFSKVPKLYGPFSRVAVPFVSQERRGFKSSNFTVLFLFVPLKAFQKMGFPKQAVGSFTNWSFWPEKFSGLSRNGPLV